MFLHRSNMNGFIKQKGFTLLELLLYIATSAAILLVISGFLSVLLKARIKNQTVSDVEMQGQAVMRLMTQTIRNSSAINSPANGVSASSISLNTYVPAQNPTIFDLSGGVLQIKEGVGAVIPLTNSRVTVSGVTFHNLSRVGSPGTVHLQFTLTRVNVSGRNEYTYTKTFTGSASLRQP
jgi:Tfp pilus assembly protein PilW